MAVNSVYVAMPCYSKYLNITSGGKRRWLCRVTCLFFGTNTQHTHRFAYYFFFFIKRGYRVVNFYINKPLNIHSNRSHRITLQLQRHRTVNFILLQVARFAIFGKKKRRIVFFFFILDVNIVSMKSGKRQKRYIWLHRATGDLESKSKWRGGGRQRQRERETAAHLNKDRNMKRTGSASHGARFYHSHLVSSPVANSLALVRAQRHLRWALLL